MIHIADGTLKFDTKIDTNGVEKGTRTIKGSLNSFLNSVKALGSQTSNAFNDTSGMDKSNVKIQQLVSELEQYRDGLYYLEKQGLYFGDSEYDEAYSKLSRLENELNSYKKSLSSVNSGQTMVSKSVMKMGKSADRSKKSVSGLGRSLQLLKMSLMFSIAFQALSGAINAIKTGFQNLVQYDSTANQSVSALMTALLQLKNSLATAFSPILTAITPALVTMINYLSAAITKIGEFFAALLLGKSTFTKAKTAQVDYAKSLDKTNKKSKDANKQLSDIDKLHNTTDTKSQDSSTGTPGMPTPSQMFEKVKINPAILKFVDSLKAKLKPLVAAFDRLKVAVAPFAKNVGAGLKWLYDNVLVPLASWTVTDLLPAFLDLLGAAITALNSVLVTFQPLALWLMNNFLIPIASWTGGMIITVLKSLTDGLYALSDWILKNQTTVQNAALVLGLFFAAFNITSLVASLPTLITSLTGATTAGELLSLALSGLGTIFSTIFSPITLVAGLITLLVYSFIDLYKNSETFRQSIADLGSTWLTALQPLADFVSTVLTDAWNKILKPAIDFFIKTLLPQLIATFKNLWQNVLVPLGTFIGTVLQPIFKILSDLLTMIWQNVILPLAQAIGSVFKEAWNGIYEILNKTVIPTIKTVISVLQQLWENVINPIISVLWKNLKPAFETVFNGIKTVINGLKTTLNGIIKFITGVLTGNWEKAWQGIKDIFKGIFDSLVGIVKTPINLIIDIINGLISGIATGINTVIGAINGLKIDVPGWMSDLTGMKSIGFNIPTIKAPKIPKLATGTVVPANYGEFMSIMGDSRYPEIVSPVPKIEEAVENVLNRMGLSGGGQYTFIAQMNGKTIFQETVTQDKMYKNQNGHSAFAY